MIWEILTRLESGDALTNAGFDALDTAQCVKLNHL